MDKAYQVSVSPKANQMLVDHAAFLAGVSESAAQSLIAEFREKASSLERCPERCPWLWDEMLPQHKYRKLILSEKYLIIFQVIGDAVLIEYVVDCRQDYIWLIAGGNT